MIRFLPVTVSFVVAAALSSSMVHAAEPTPIPAGHPLIGTWRIDLPDRKCHELYEVRPDGTLHVTSGQQVVTSMLTVSAKQSGRGFYQWVDRITAENGKPDCTGAVMEVGHVSTNYVILDAPGKEFLMCTIEDINTCLGPFVRQGDGQK